MKSNNPKRLTMLKNIRRASAKKLPKPFQETLPFEWQSHFDDDNVVEFANQFVFNGGHFQYTESAEEFFNEVVHLSRKKKWKFVYCWDKELYEYWQEIGFTECKIGKNPYNISAAVVRCEGVVAQNGLILLSNKQAGAIEFASSAPILIVMVNISQVFTSLAKAFAHIRSSRAKEPIKQLIQLSGKSHQHPFFEAEHTGFNPQEVIVYMVDEAFELDL